jgi:hypothetical protein
MNAQLNQTLGELQTENQQQAAKITALETSLADLLVRISALEGSN